METVENLLDDIFSPSAESVNTHNTEHMITAFVKETYFKIQLPIAVAPSFTTEFGSLSNMDGNANNETLPVFQ